MKQARTDATELLGLGSLPSVDISMELWKIPHDDFTFMCNL